MGNPLEALVHAIALFDEFPHPLTGSGPLHLIRLSKALGLEALAASWLRCTGKALPDPIRSALENEL